VKIVLQKDYKIRFPSPLQLENPTDPDDNQNWYLKDKDFEIVFGKKS
jgi:hypothetical protein